VTVYVPFTNVGPPVTNVPEYVPVEAATANSLASAMVPDGVFMVIATYVPEAAGAGVTVPETVTVAPGV